MTKTGVFELGESGGQQKGYEILLAIVHDDADWANGVRFFEALGFERSAKPQEREIPDHRPAANVANGAAVAVGPAIESWLANTDNATARAVFFYESPEHWVVQRMKKGVLPSDALQEWLDATQQAVIIARRHGDTCGFLRVSDVCAAPRESANALATWLGADLRRPAATRNTRETAGGCLFRLIAQTGLGEHIAVAELHREVQAARIAVGVKAPSNLADSAFLEWESELKELSAQFEDKLENERRLLTNDIHDLQERLGEMPANLKLEVAALRRPLADRDAKLKERDAKLKERHAKLKERDAELKKLTSSRSWKITSPLRWISRVLGLAR